MAGSVRMTINPIHVRCGQSAREVYNDVITAILYLLWYELVAASFSFSSRRMVSLRSRSKGRRQRSVRRKITGAVKFFYWASALSSVANDAGVIKRS